ncbi:hypothetical protein B0H34DRAFT_799971 [Crassisporium funariophilum]|nr:hypothetical protein B0H34DRAFT_799971 [Crassisporium funariophilum]
MQRFNFAASRRVNPDGISPKLTEAHVWKGLEMKARKPGDFISVVKSCDVLSDTGNKVLRSVVFQDASPVNEEIDLYEGTIGYFEIPTLGYRITNVLSYDKDDELTLTFSFAGGIPGRAVGSVAPSTAELNASVGKGVEHTIAKIRELVKTGALKE